MRKFIGWYLIATLLAWNLWTAHKLNRTQEQRYTDALGTAAVWLVEGHAKEDETPGWRDARHALMNEYDRRMGHKPRFEP